jgi:hypothetical protein
MKKKEEDTPEYKKNEGQYEEENNESYTYRQEQSLLLGADSPAPRSYTVLHDLNSELITIIGLQLSETEDSFLVAYPSRTFKKNTDPEEICIKPFLEQNINLIRILKSSIFLCTFPVGIFKQAYIKYLREETNAKEEYPDAIFDSKDEVPANYDEYDLYESTDSAGPISIKLESSTDSNSIDAQKVAEEEIIVCKSYSEKELEELEDKLIKKALQGCIITNGSKTKQ